MGNVRDVVIDIETNGPSIYENSMIAFGAVIVEPGFQRTFYAKLKPITNIYVPEALAVCGFTHEQTLKFPDPRDAMQNFEQWLNSNITGRPVAWSDNNGYDMSWITAYFWKYLNRSPFGWSSANIGSLYKGITGDIYSNFKHLRDTKHTHHPVDDAKGNAEALLKMFNMMKNNRRNS